MKFFIIWLSYMFFWSSIISFGLVLFRFKIRQFLPHILFGSFGLSTIGVIMQSPNLVPFLSMVLFASGTCCMWLILRFPFGHALLLMTVSYMVALMTEWLMNLLLPATTIVVISEDNQFRFLASAVLMSSFHYLYCMVLRRFRLGFSFLSQSYTGKQFFKQNSKTFKAAICISILVLLTTSILFYMKPGLNYILAPPALLGLTILFKISYRWEFTE
ncbi:hypothetical protein SD70_31265 [Gordoniibacillus kamchatkensis]|uniref:Uncharacterized protein n=1 Tax=Gordoniibacillus kamchatkensis TaxID=1590651 RepID=A0ABR5A8S8_9BACL|nr:hypothetical protein [Paenibacillus sp. VKM B-2647]KIL36807.1 hypothetical protein SD70_31265 [Paenibacillus sp. VKM B-2647]